MSAALRFLAVAVIGWGALRAASLGVLPGAEMLSVERSEAAVPPIVATSLPPIEPPPAYAEEQFTYAVAQPGPPAPVPAAYYAPYQPSARSAPVTPIAHTPPPLFYSPIPQLDDWPLSRLASASLPARRSTPAAATAVASGGMSKPRLDRLRLTAWSLLRQRPGPGSLASAGTLGGSQAGARLTYYVTPQIAASLRTSSPIGRSSGGEVAGGVRIAPFRSIPVALTVERRQAFGRGGGRSAFALFLEGGLYQRPMPWRFQLDAYAQAGIVGARRRDLFADGALTLTRPLYGRFSGGFGLWGGVQPGLYRVDAGPRLTMRVRDNVRVHVDWRQRVAGNASPPSGPALTLAGDF